MHFSCSIGLTWRVFRSRSFSPLFFYTLFNTDGLMLSLLCHPES